MTTFRLSLSRRAGSSALALALVPTLLGGCATVRKATPLECAAVGAVLLAGTGGAVGSEIDDNDGHDTAGPAVGAAVGAVVGAGTGYLLCSLLPEAKPAPPPPIAKPAPPPPPVAPKQQPARIVLRGVNFAHDSAVIDASSAVVLDVAAETLRSNSGVRVGVEGHTDSTGSDTYNQSLSERRAASVRDYLVKAGVSAGRLDTAGYGETNPVASNDTDDGRRMNRRVELKIRE